jgi:hypothetical protein
MVMDMHKRGWTTIAVTVGLPTPERPRGGTYERLEKRLQYRKQSWDEVITELLDESEKNTTQVEPPKAP